VSDELIYDGPANGIATLVLNRPAELNAWTYGLEHLFFEAFDAAVADPAVRVLVVTGAGRGFCAGASMQLLGDGDRSLMPERARRRRLIELLECPKPIIAAVNGPAVGIGLALALACDIRIAALNAKMATSFGKLGLPAEHGVAWMLPRIIGGARARDLLLSGRTIDGEEAAALGLVNRAIPAEDVVPESVAYARRLVESASPASWAAIKRQLLDAEHLTVAEAYEQAADLMGPALLSADHREAVTAYREQRVPNFAPYTA
jgi:enoyl-CoA hydratase/carnithine racemase